jgi:hypothetical protein
MPTALAECDPTIPALTSPTANVPALAIQAASELDDVIQGRTQNSPASKKLGDLIQAAVPRKNGNSLISLTSGTVAVFSQAFEEVQQPINTMSDLVTLVNQVSRELSTTNPEPDLAKLKQFCLALARAASSYRPAIDTYDPQFVKR